MTRPTDPMDPALAQALSAVALPRARSAFKDELRERFVHGKLEPSPLSLEAREPDGRPAPRLARRLAIGAAIAAGLAALVMLGPSQADRKEWSVVGGEGFIRVAGRTLPPSERDGFRHALQDGRRLVNEGPLYLGLDAQVFVEVAPSSEITLQPVAEELGIYTHEGGIRVSTGPDFPGHMLVVQTPHARLEVTGTIFAVDITPMGTCICCTDGEIRLHEETGVSMVRSGESVLATGHAPKRMAMPEDHARDLAGFEKRSRRHWSVPR